MAERGFLINNFMKILCNNDRQNARPTDLIYTAKVVNRGWALH